MKEYHKINTVFKRDMENNGKSLRIGDYSTPEFEYLKDNLWEWTEKVDGTCIRIMIGDGKVSFGGKTDNAQIPANLVEQLRLKFDPQVELLNETFPLGACLYGEGCGPKIQKGGGNYGPKPQFVLFDVLVGPWWLSRKDVSDLATKFAVADVPVIGEGTLHDLVDFISAGSMKSQWGDFEAEGVVARPKVEMFTRAGHRIITKLKLRDFRV